MASKPVQLMEPFGGSAIVGMGCTAPEALPRSRTRQLRTRLEATYPLDVAATRLDTNSSQQRPNQLQ